VPQHVLPAVAIDNKQAYDLDHFAVASEILSVERRTEVPIIIGPLLLAS
jgi:hypothetical protein